MLNIIQGIPCNLGLLPGYPGQSTATELSVDKCCVTVSGKTWTNVSLPPDKELTVVQSMDTTNVQLGELMSFIRVTY